MCVLLLPRNIHTGPSSRFSDADVFEVLRILRTGKRIGRGRIASQIGLGEGSARNLIDIMASIDLLKIEQTGVTITEYGSTLFDMLRIRPVEMDTDRYALGKHMCGILVGGKADVVTDGTTQRNEAIRLGGEGCTTWVMRNGNVIMVPDWNVDTTDPAFGVSVREHTGISEGDALIFVGADDPKTARTAAIEVALGLI